ncbi:MAG: signal peptidase I [Chloroflexi bacterium]|nr:signal peptidase I [Chloroflexota bacterium]
MKKNLGNILFFGLCGLMFFIIFCQMGILPFRFVYLFSGSMRPTYQPGDLAVVFVQKDIAVKPGDVVLFSAAIGPTIHRVVAVEDGRISTQGDANNAIDMEKINSVDGKVLFAIPKIGYAIDFIQVVLRSMVKST